MDRCIMSSVGLLSNVIHCSSVQWIDGIDGRRDEWLNGFWMHMKWLMQDALCIVRPPLCEYVNSDVTRIGWKDDQRGQSTATGMDCWLRWSGVMDGA